MVSNLIRIFPQVSYPAPVTVSAPVRATLPTSASASTGSLVLTAPSGR